MKSLKFLGFIFLMTLSTFIMQGQPQFDPGEDPKPAGKSWEIIGNMSDDFNDNSFNTTKWHKWRADNGTGNSDWIGRPPGLFKNWTVTEGADPNGVGCLKITNYYLEQPEWIDGNKYTHAGGFVGSHETAMPGYYMECRMKASKTFMSSTFWLVSECVPSNQAGYPNRKNELDIQETFGSGTRYWDKNIGQYVTGDGNTNFPLTFTSHVHDRKSTSATSCNDNTWNSSQHSNGLMNDETTSSRYFVYGAWWKNPNEILFYIDGKYAHTLYPNDKFNLPMYLRMVSETYNWNEPWTYQNKDGMQLGINDRTVYYDWVRTWKLVDGGGGGGGNTASIPGKIEAESYSAQSGIGTQNTSDVGGGQNVGWTDQWDYMDYQVNVAQAGCYDVQFRVAAANKDIKFNLIRDGNFLINITSTPTGGWQTWKTVTRQVNLPAGNQTLRILALDSGWNINWIDFKLCDDAPVGKRIAFRKTGGDWKWVTAEQSANDKQLIARGSQIQSWEKFDVYDNPNGGISLKAVSNGKFVQSNNTNPNVPLKAKGNAPSDWERFTWKDKGPGKMALKSLQTNKWVQAAWNQGNAVLYPKGASDLNWETFEYTILGNSPNALIAPGNDAGTFKAPIDFLQEFSAEIYPNPMDAQEELFVDVIMPQNGDVDLSVFDIQGKQLYTNTYNNLQQGGYTITLDAATIFTAQKGIYILKVSSGTNQKVLKLIR